MRLKLTKLHLLSLKAGEALEEVLGVPFLECWLEPETGTVGDTVCRLGDTVLGEPDLCDANGVSERWLVGDPDLVSSSLASLELSLLLALLLGFLLPSDLSDLWDLRDWIELGVLVWSLRTEGSLRDSLALWLSIPYTVELAGLTSVGE